MAVTSRHNKYTSIPDWFSGQSTETATTSPISQTVYIGGSSSATIAGSTVDFKDIPIDNSTIIWLNEQLAVPIDNDKIIIVDGKVTTSANASGVWELRQLTDGTNYIYTTYPVVTQLGITMYSGTEGFDIGGIYDGLPIDNNTIYWDIDSDGNRVLKAIGSSGGGVADSVAWANVDGKPTWLLDDKISYSEIEGTPDLSNYVVKSYVDDNFVTFTLDEVISGIKSFTNGLKIGESLIKQLQNDVVYIDANLVVRGGVTMYYDGGEIDIPNIKDQIGPAGYNEKGLASFDQTYFTIDNGHVSLIEGAVGLNEDELLNYLTNNQYAKKSDIPSLNGYATQSWVESKGFALNSDLTVLSTKVNDFLEGSDTDNIINKWKELEAFLTGLDGSNDLATILSWKADKTYVDETFVTIGGDTEQTITGPKNFTGGLKVNGSPIYYDTEKKYWKLEGDLLITGGVTMYGNEGTFIPSTIMGAILYDDTTLGINAQGQLYVKGGTGGGTVSGDYLPLSGGELSGSLAVTAVQNGYWAGGIRIDGTTSKYPSVGFHIANVAGSRLYVNESFELIFEWSTYNPVARHKVLHSGNYYNYALPLSGGTIESEINLPLTIKRNNAYGVGISFANTNETISIQAYNGVLSRIDNSDNGYTIWDSGNDGSGSGLDADLLDGYDNGSFFINRNIALNANNINTTLIPGCYHTANYSPISGTYKYGTVLNFRGGARQTQFYIPDGAQSYANGGRLFFRDSWNANDSITTAWYEIITSASVGSFNAGTATRIQAYTHDSGDKVLLSGTRSDNTYERSIYDNGWGLMLKRSLTNTVGYIATLNDNVASATKLQTPRTIWGQSFDGTGNVSGDLIGSRFSGTLFSSGFNDTWSDGTNSHVWYGYDHRYPNTGVYSTTITDYFGLTLRTASGFISMTQDGNVGIGTTTPSYKLDIVGHCRSEFMCFFNKDWNGNAGYIGRGSNGNNRIILYAASDDVYVYSKGVVSTIFTGANMLVQGGITMYSARKLKTIQDERGLSLEELSVIKPTRFTWKDGRDDKVHIGGIADDVQKVLPEVIYKTDNDTLTMDYGNAAFAIAASLIKPVVNHEERIRLLEEENKRLKEEVEYLKLNIA